MYCVEFLTIASSTGPASGDSAVVGTVVARTGAERRDELSDDDNASLSAKGLAGSKSMVDDVASPAV